ncbi:MAG: orotate phosphoribosyltransferase [Candidatus Peregrinibacteria bacterium]|nr:orotate phosphoribosyltransferase [Candidatus Peregrinibacteria bacterium]
MDSRRIAEILLNVKAVKISFDPPFTYASGMKAPIYTDNRVLVSHVSERKEVIDGLCELANQICQQNKWNTSDVFYAGTATAGIPWASFVAMQLNAPMVYVRPKPKEHGTGKQIEGSLPELSKVIVVEDLVTTGGSSLATATVLETEAKSGSNDIIAIFTYGFPPTYKMFEEQGVALHTLTDFDTLLDVAKEKGMITQEQFEKVLEYKADPQGWAAKMGL